jgi:hypothetical protein
MAALEKDRLFIAHMDLKVVSVIMGLLVIFSVTFETTDMSVPGWAGGSSPNKDDNGGGPGTNQTVEPVTVDVLSKDGQTSEGSSTPVNVDVEQPGLLKLTVKLTWVDDIGSNDEFGLAISNETGELDTTQGTSGSLEIVLSAPDDGYLEGPFEVKVSALNCPGRIGPLPVDMDSGNSWTLTVTALVEG